MVTRGKSRTEQPPPSCTARFKNQRLAGRGYVCGSPPSRRQGARPEPTTTQTDATNATRPAQRQCLQTGYLGMLQPLPPERQRHTTKRSPSPPTPRTSQPLPLWNVLTARGLWRGCGTHFVRS